MTPTTVNTWHEIQVRIRSEKKLDCHYRPITSLLNPTNQTWGETGDRCHIFSRRKAIFYQHDERMKNHVADQLNE